MKTQPKRTHIPAPRSKLTSPKLSKFKLFPSILLLVLAVTTARSQTPAQTTSQQLSFAGLRTVAMQGQINAVKTDAAGNLYLLLNQGDGVRLLKTDSSASTILAQALLGAKGDIGLALALDPAGNLYVTGTTTSTALAATPGAAIPNRTDASTQSFVARFDPNLTPVFVTFAGGSKIAASSIAATGDAVFITGQTYATNLPVTPTAIQQAPAPGSSGNGFVERFSSSGTTLVYATYLTGASGDTNPTAITADSSDSAYITGSTSASGFPTVAALVPNILSNPSGFLTKLTSAGDAITFSTFVPGSGLTSLTLDATGNVLLLSGSVALGQFPVDTVAAPIAAPLTYQTLLRVPTDGSTVLSGTLLVPGSQSFATPDTSGGVWLDGTLTTPLFSTTALAETGTLFATHVNAANQIDQTARFGGLPNGNPTFASLPAIPTSIAVDPSGNPLIAGAVEPTASSSLLATQTYDLPLRNGPTPAFPSTVANAGETAATCNGSQCAGSAAYLARLTTGVDAPALSFSAADLPFITLRNLGSATAGTLQLATTSGNFTTNCPAALAPGASCNILLSGGTPGTLTATSTNDTQAISYPTYAAPAATIAFYPKELDFGIQTSTSPAAQRTITVTNLGTTSQTFASAINSSARTLPPFTEAASDCTLAGSITRKLLAPGGTCHITLAFAPYTTSPNDGPLTAQWSIGGRDVLLTAESQAGSLSLSATEIDFGTQYAGGLRVPRYLYLSNSSTSPIAHAALSLPADSPFTLTDACPSTLIPGSVCRIRIDYHSATVPSNDSATLTLDAGLTSILTGQSLLAQGVTGTMVNPNLSISPAAITFANPVAVTSTGTETQTVTIANTGTAPFALSLTLTGDFLLNTSCTALLAGNSTCAVALTFAPSSPGTRSGLLAVTAGPGTSPAYVSLSASATAILTANNGTLALGSTPIGQPLVAFYKVAQPFSSLAAAVTGPFAVAFVTDNGFTPATPPASAFAASVTGPCPSCFLAVEFLPTTAGPQSGTLTLASAPSGNPYTLALTGAATSSSGLLLTPATQDFGAVPVHSSSGPVLFTLTNNTAAAITLPAPQLSGDYSFLQSPTGAQTCSGSLVAGASCQVQVAAAPSTTGTRPGTLTLATATATLTTLGSPDPGLALNPTQVTFLNVPGPASTTQTITLTNTGTVPLAIAALSVAAPFAASTPCTTLAPAASCTLTVVYTAGSTLAAGALTFTANGVPYSIALSGGYTAASAGLQLVPALANFGPAPAGAPTSAQIFTLNNLTQATQAVSLLIPRQFTLTSAPCTTVAPGGSCSFSLAFLPLDNGSISGSLIATSAPGTSTIAYAEGYGTGAATLALTGGLIVDHTFNFGQVTSGQTSAQTFTLTNPSTTSTLTIHRVTSPPPFLASTTCGSALAPGGTCTATVTYAPTNQVATGTASPASTTDSGALTLESDATSSPDVLNLTGQAGPLAVTAPASPTVVASYTLSQQSLTFPSTRVGNVSAPQVITLTNTGTVAVNLLALNTTADYTASTTCTSLLPAASCTVTVSATPQSAGTHIASLELLTTAATALDFVSLTSTSIASPITLTPAALIFGPTIVGASSTQPVQISNTGSTPITFTSISATGDYAAAGSCPAPAAILPAGQSCTVQVTFTPTTTGTRSGTLAIATTASTNPLTVTLTGTGIQSRLTIAPSSLNFGSLVLGASANLSLTLANNGTAPISALTLTPAGDYSVSLPCPSTLLAGASCTAQVTFTPTALGARPGTLTVRSSDPSSPIVIPLTGTAITAGTFTLTVDAAASASVTVKSGGPATYTLTVTPAGNFAGSVALTCAPIQPAQFASCSIAPATLTLAGAAQNSTATINTITSADGSAALVRPRRTTTSRAEKFLCLLVPGTWLLFKRRRTLRRRLPILLALLFITATLAVSGCGSQGGDFNTRYTPPGTYAYQVTATSTSGIQITQTVMLNLTVTSR